jgi:large subunit ribosomal protein L5
MQKMQTADLRGRYKTEIKQKLKKSLNKENIFQVPKMEKIVINVGFGRLAPDEKGRESIANNLAKLTGQKPIFTAAKKAIAGFKIRKGQIIGAKSTLRAAKMFQFFEKLTAIVLPRIRDFRGVSEKSFDGQGNFTLGFRDTSVFPEMEYNKGEKLTGLEVVIHTTAKTDEEAKALFTELGVPFQETKRN